MIGEDSLLERVTAAAEERQLSQNALTALPEEGLQSSVRSVVSGPDGTRIASCVSYRERCIVACFSNLIIYDCKLGCETKAATILQLSLYSELLERLSVRGRFKRQPHIKLCAIGTRAEVDFPVMPLDDDPVADNQAESRA